MEFRFKNFGLYNVDLNYMRYLYENYDKEVFFSEDKDYTKKPFLGILITIQSYTYFIPLTSGKMRHKKWRIVGKDYFLIYEKADLAHIHHSDITKKLSDNEIIKILSMLDIRKMIPVPEGSYRLIRFKEVSDPSYRDLLQKEFSFCQGIQEGILKRAEKIYTEQKLTGKIYPFYCDYSRLEAACDAYSPQNGN